ncbi:hypothetical protein JAAARDRAFT_135989, partial [Jaapia argillacea MUCL 33604]
ISGSERKDMARVLLACLVGKVPQSGIIACCALLDFIYQAQNPTHDNTTLSYMRDALNTFHAHRQIFITLGIQKDFNIPKFHSLLHYITAIRNFGTTDNYNTEMFEHLHIDLAKDTWHSTNHKDECPQMVKWVTHQEKVSSFDGYISWMERLCSRQANSSNLPILRNKEGSPIKLTKRPHSPNCLLDKIKQDHSAPSLRRDLTKYLATLSAISPTRYTLPFEYLDTYHNVKFSPPELHNQK